MQRIRKQKMHLKGSFWRSKWIELQQRDKRERIHVHDHKPFSSVTTCSQTGTFLSSTSFSEKGVPMSLETSPSSSSSPPSSWYLDVLYDCLNDIYDELNFKFHCLCIVHDKISDSAAHNKWESERKKLVQNYSMYAVKINRQDLPPSRFTLRINSFPVTCLCCWFIFFWQREIPRKKEVKARLTQSFYHFSHSSLFSPSAEPFFFPSPKSFSLTSWDEHTFYGWKVFTDLQSVFCDCDNLTPTFSSTDYQKCHPNERRQRMFPQQRL